MQLLNLCGFGRGEFDLMFSCADIFMTHTDQINLVSVLEGGLSSAAGPAILLEGSFPSSSSPGEEKEKS